MSLHSFLMHFFADFSILIFVHLSIIFFFRSFVRLFINSCTSSCMRSFFRSSTHWFVPSLAHVCNHLHDPFLTHWFTRTFADSCFCLTLLFTSLFAQLLTQYSFFSLPTKQPGRCVHSFFPWFAVVLVCVLVSSFIDSSMEHSKSMKQGMMCDWLRGKVRGGWMIDWLSEREWVTLPEFNESSAISVYN